MPARKPTVIGERFGRLTVIGHPQENRYPFKAIVKCECGVATVKSEALMRNGSTTSCGCAFIDRCKSGDNGRRHSMRGTRIYTIWSGMIQRCTNPKNPNHPRWGGRGITFDPRWRDFTEFLKDMGEPPSRDMTIERVDNDLNYCKENCRWATRKEQAQNTSKVRLVFIDGVRMNTLEAAEAIGISPAAIRQRMRTHRVTRQEAVDYYAAKRKDL